MKLEIRAPKSGEWKLCRMLLPETFRDADFRDYLICLREEQPRLAGAMSFRRVGDVAKELRLHVVPAMRRRGVASRMVEWLGENGLGSAEGMSETLVECGAPEFCERVGFELTETLTTVEIEVDGALKYLRQLREKVGMPASARLVSVAEAPFDQVARLHAEQVVHQAELNPWRAVLSQAKGVERSPAVMVNSEVAGFLFWDIEGDLATVHSRVVAPGYRGGWVVIALLADTIEAAWKSGARRMRFSYVDSNRDTQRLAQRFQAKTVGLMVKFSRKMH